MYVHNFTCPLTLQLQNMNLYSLKSILELHTFSVLVGKKKSLLHFVGSILVSPVREPVL